MRWVILMAVVALAGCAGPRNPSFPVTSGEARDAIAEMERHPKALARPLVVIGGFLDLNVSPPLFAHFFRGVTSQDALIIPVSVGTCGSFDECRAKVIAAVDRASPSGDPNWTSEVDVVGASLGGLVARYAAAPPRNGAAARRLKVTRLFTISSPHSGATLARSVGFTDFHRDMQPGSAFLKRLAGEDAAAKYELVAYVHLGDEIVGEQYAAPPGKTAYWLANDSILPPHGAAMLDRRILADIARRLRGEEALTRLSAAPLPAKGA